MGRVLLLFSLLLSASALLPVQDGPRLHITHDGETQEIILEVGPIELPARASHHDVVQPPAVTGELPVDGWLHGYEVDIVDGQGNAIPQRVLHHVNLIAPDHRELFSPIMRRIGAAGHETGPVRLPRLIGYPIRQGEGLMIATMVHNPTDQDYDDAYVRIRMTYTPADVRIPRFEIYPFYMDVMPPASIHAYDLPPGRSEKSWEGQPAVSGRILGVGGHLHDHGVALILEDVTRGKVIWEARPVLDEDGRVIAMPTKRFLWRFGVPLRRDHTYRLTAIYDNPTGETIEGGAMGALGGIFRPSRREQLPPADVNDPEYVLDVRLVTEGSHEHGGHGHHGHTDHEDHSPPDDPDDHQGHQGHQGHSGHD
jgi:hypothetical protein